MNQGYTAELAPSAHAQPWRTEATAMVKLAGPIVLTQLGWVAMLTTDAAMIGRLGAVPLAGATLVLMVYFGLYVFGFGVVMATATLASQAFGARRPRLVRRVIRQGLWATILIVTPSIVLLAWTPEILTLLRQPAEAIAFSGDYIETLKWSLAPAIAFVVLRNFVSALNRPAFAMWVMLAGVPLNAALDYALIFGKLGAPRLELFGAGLATTSVSTFLFALLLAVALFRRPFRRYNILGRFWRPDWDAFRRIFALGLPIAGIMLLEAGFFICAVFLMGWISTATVAAHMIAIQVPHVTFMVPMGLSQAATVRVGHAVGRRDPAGAYRAGWTAIAMSLAFMGVVTLVILAFPASLASVFLDTDRPDSAAVLALATSFLLFAAIFQAADGIQAVAAGALRGLNDTAVPMGLAALCYWAIGFTSAGALAFWGRLEGVGVWIGFVVALVAAALVMTWRFRNLARRHYIPEMPPERETL
ncbi:MAG: MATE family efflux transporter [Alphaproteobacteria bacterium]|nr:MATE family efflux transporter [Alphaproteobacteria bacterium]